jgi:hypothetical protein
MDGKALVIRIVLLILAFAILDAVLSVIFLGPRGLFGNILGLVIDLVLGFFLISGQAWARWWMAIRCGIGALTTFGTWSGLAKFDFGFFSLIRLWLLISAIFCAAIAAYLLFSRRVNDHFNPGSGF